MCGLTSSFLSRPYLDLFQELSALPLPASCVLGPIARRLRSAFFDANSVCVKKVVQKGMTRSIEYASLAAAADASRGNLSSPF